MAQSSTTDAQASARRGHGNPWLTLLAVALGVMMVLLDGTVVAIANPVIGVGSAPRSGRAATADAPAHVG
jgi:hypothetical protein